MSRARSRSLFGSEAECARADAITTCKRGWFRLAQDMPEQGLRNAQHCLNELNLGVVQHTRLPQCPRVQVRTSIELLCLFKDAKISVWHLTDRSQRRRPLALDLDQRHYVCARRMTRPARKRGELSANLRDHEPYLALSIAPDLLVRPVLLG